MAFAIKLLSVIYMNNNMYMSNNQSQEWVDMECCIHLCMESLFPLKGQSER